MAYQADIAKFEQAGSQVIGISVDSRAKNSAFARQLGIRFPILSDEARTVSKQYGVLMPLIRLAKRTTFLIEERGIIRVIQKGGEAADPGNVLAACTLAASTSSVLA
jgi:thioredoxin-dependent peroxiredoxin